MKKFSGTWVVVAVFGALLVFLLVAKPKTREEAKEAELTIVSADREKLERVAITSSSGTFVLEKKDEAWRITSPRDLPVEESTLNQVKNALSGLVASDPVWPVAGPEERTKAGLDAPSAKVVWKAGDREGTLEVGRKLSDDETYYVASSEKPGIYTARKWSVEVFTKGLESYRRRKIVEFDRDSIRTIILEVPGREPLLLNRGDAVDPWMASTPFVGRADRGRANGLLTRLGNLRAEEFVDDPPREAGLDGLRGSISLSADGGRAWTVLIGAEEKNGNETRFFVRDGERGQVALAEGPVPEDLVPPFSEWRDKQLFDFFADDVSTVELVLDEPLRVSRNADRMFATTGGTPVVVNTETAAFLRSARDARVTEFGRDAPEGSAASKALGLENPVVEARWTVLGDEHSIAIGTTKPGSTLRWVRTHESPSAVLVDAEPIVKAAASLAAAASAPPPTVTPTPTATPASAAVTPE